MKSLTTLAVVLGLLSPMASADEVWNTNTGKITYESDIGPTAVWSYGTKGKEDEGAIYLVGLAQVYTARQQYDGYWAQKTSKQKCTSQRLGLNNELTSYWGRMQVRFLDADFPSRWEAVWSYCDGPAENTKITADPLVAK